MGTPEDFYNEALLYRLFGVNAELLIDHAWGWESCTMQEIKKYKPSANSLGSGQVLQCPYPYEKALLVVREMADQLALELVDKELVTDQVVLTVGYDIENLRDPSIRGRYHGEVKKIIMAGWYRSMHMGQPTCRQQLPLQRRFLRQLPDCMKKL